MKKNLILVLLIYCSLPLAFGQSSWSSTQHFGESLVDKYDKNTKALTDEYESAVFKNFQQYDTFYREANERYAKALKEAWEKFDVEVPDNNTVLIDSPVAPLATESFLSDVANSVVKGVKKVITKINIPRLFKPRSKAQPVQASVPSESTPSQFHFDYYGTDLSVRLDESCRFTLDGVEPADVASAWYKLNEKPLRTVTNDCLWLRDSLRLNGWGYYTMLKEMSDTFLGAGSNESVLLQDYLLMQSGYKVRIGRSGTRLVTLIPSEYDIYNKVCVRFNDGYKYYLFGEYKSGAFQTINVFTSPLSNKEEMVSLGMETLPLLKENPGETKTFKSRKYKDINIEITPDTNIVRFFNDYPLCNNWEMYSLASLSKHTKEALKPLEQYIKGKDEQEQVNILMNFIQTGFDYGSDDALFGQNRSLFGDENFFYPYNDCEDRSILLSILVREYLNLDVVFIYYPGQHLCTAINFHDPVKVDVMDNFGRISQKIAPHVEFEGKIYTICDPTYVAVPIGYPQPTFIGKECEIVKIQ